MTLKTVLVYALLLSILVLSYEAWKFFGMPYYKLSLIGREFISDSDELYVLNEDKQSPYLLAKKYRFSKKIWIIGYGGGSIRREDYFSLGVFTQSKKELIPLKYQYINAIGDFKTNEIYIVCTPFYFNGDEPTDYFKIENNQAIRVDRVPF